MATRSPRLILSGFLLAAGLGAATEPRSRPAATATATATATAADGLTVRGDVRSPAKFQVAELQALESITRVWSQHGQERQLTGVPLMAVLRRAGWEAGPEGKSVPPRDKHSGHRQVLVATAADGYQAVFSAAELTEGKTEALIVWSIDGKPLPAASGPLRLVVPSDSGMARSTFQLRALDVVDVRKLVPPHGER
jgi:DMSO/TMAO reductase YedYZ molybdopterin-dependent catalytic subunit